MPQDEGGRNSNIKSKTENTIARLSQLLEATPAAEELSRTWCRSKDETLQRDGPRLQDLRRALDAGKVIEQGIPMWIVVNDHCSRNDAIVLLTVQLLIDRFECARRLGIRTVLGRW